MHAHPTWRAADCAHAVLRKSLPTVPWGVYCTCKNNHSKTPAGISQDTALRIIFSLLRECLLPFQERTPVNLSNLLLGASHTTIPVKYKKQTPLCLTLNFLRSLQYHVSSLLHIQFIFLLFQQPSVIYI